MPPDTWITTSVAAELCRVTPKTVQRWIASGRVTCRKEVRGSRTFFLVLKESLPGESPNDATDATATHDATQPPAVRLDTATAALIGAMHERLRVLEEQNRTLLAEVQELRALPAPARPAEEDPALRAMAAGLVRQEQALREVKEQNARLADASDRQAQENARLAALVGELKEALAGQQQATAATAPPSSPPSEPLPKRRPWWQPWRR